MSAIETSRTKIVRRLESEGWVLQRSRGGHDIYKHPTRGAISVPRHRTLSPGVARSIAQAAGWI